MIAITTSSSIRVKPDQLMARFPDFLDAKFMN